MFSADKDAGPFPPVSLLCCLAIPDIGREIAESNHSHPYILLPIEQTINNTGQHGPLLIPLPGVEMRKSELNVCSTATLTVLFYLHHGFSHLHKEFSVSPSKTFSISPFLTQPGRLTPCAHILTHSHTSQNKYWTGKEKKNLKKEQLKATANMALSLIHI